MCLKIFDKLEIAENKTFNVLSNYISKEIFCGQATKSKRWMPWRQEAMKDVVSCVKLRGVAKQTLIRRFPNGETLAG